MLALTADHGICPLPEASRAGAGREAGGPDGARRRGSRSTWRRRSGRRGPEGEEGAGWVEATQRPVGVPEPALVGGEGEVPAEVARSLADYLGRTRTCARAFTREDLDADRPGRRGGRQVRRSYHPERCGDVYVVLKPFDLPGEAGEHRHDARHAVRLRHLGAAAGLRAGGAGRPARRAGDPAGDGGDPGAVRRACRRRTTRSTGCRPD